MAKPGTRDYGYLTIAAQVGSQPQIALAIPPGAFSPAPKVQSALVTFQMKAKFERWPRRTVQRFSRVREALLCPKAQEPAQ